MKFREDVLRGLRFGGIAFAALLVGVAIYRVGREPAPPELTQPVEPVAPLVETPAKSVATPPQVPAPPPIGSSRAQVRRHPAGQKTVVADTAPVVDTQTAPIAT